MKNISFKTKHLSFWKRFKNIFFGPALVILGISILTILFGENRDYYFSTYLIIGYSIIWGLFSIFFARNFIYEILIRENEILLYGSTFNKNWVKTIDMNKFSFKIKSQSYGRGNVEYYLKIYSDNSTYLINKNRNWEYGKLLAIVETLKPKMLNMDNYLLEKIELKIKS